MMKITFYQKILAVGASSLLSIGILGLWIGATARDIPPAKITPVIDFSYLSSPNLAFASSNPFPASADAALLTNNNGKLPTNLSMPTPRLPWMPTNAAANITTNPAAPTMNMELEVIGLLPPDVAILRRGGETITARIGNSNFGYLTEVSDTGVEIDGKWIAYKK